MDYLQGSDFPMQQEPLRLIPQSGTQLDSVGNKGLAIRKWSANSEREALIDSKNSNILATVSMIVAVPAATLSVGNL